MPSTFPSVVEDKDGVTFARILAEEELAPGTNVDRTLASVILPTIIFGALGAAVTPVNFAEGMTVEVCFGGIVAAS